MAKSNSRAVSRRKKAERRNGVSRGGPHLDRVSWGEWENRSEVRFRVDAPAGLMAAFCNRKYSVQIYEHRTSIGVVYQALIRRHDGNRLRSWWDLQRIKDELFGERFTAVEVFPPRDEVVDQAHCSYLWVVPGRLPFGLDASGRGYGENDEVGMMNDECGDGEASPGQGGDGS